MISNKNKSSGLWDRKMAALPPRKNASSTKSSKQTSSPMQILLQMGFPKHRAEKALAATGERGVQLASDWLLAHVNDPTLDDNMPREYILYACPTGPLLDHLQTFWSKSLVQCGRNGAHNYLPHVTLCSFFKAPDDSVTQLVRALKQTVDNFQEELPEQLKLEHFTSPNFIGLFVVEEHAEILKKLAVQYVKEVANHISTEYERVDAFSTCFPWCSAASNVGNYRSLSRGGRHACVEPYMKSLHITLGYQFPSSQYGVLEELSRTVDVTAPAYWDIRLYSRDSRIAGNEVHKVLYSHIPTQTDELELLIGDYVYVNGDQLNNSADGWVEGTSWLTGSTGFLPKTYIEKTAESDAWTLHKSVSLCKNRDSEDPEDAGQTQRTPISLLHQNKTSGESNKSEESNSKTECNSGGAKRSSMYENVESLYAKIMKPKKMEPIASKPRKLIIVRHGERIDFTFGSWIPFCFDSSGTYTRRDLNMPKTVPSRKGGPQDFFKDCPLTEVGLLQATLVGQALSEHGIPLMHVYCSPSLRCVQTCTNILSGMGLLHIPICIEPGLFEWLAWYQDGMPTWMSLQDLVDAGYNIEMNYRPYITTEELFDRRESSEQYYMRSYYVSQSVIKSTAEKGGNILLVGHAATLDTCSRQLCGKEPRGSGDLARLVHKIPYCSVGIAEETPNGSWTLIGAPFPPITHANNLRFDWKVLMS